jgi:hypothetical protein
MKLTALLIVFTWTALIVIPLTAQTRPDLSGVWRLDAAESRRIGDGADSPNVNEVTWLIDYRDPEISVLVNVRDSDGSHEFSFGCTTDGHECVNEMPSLREVRRISAVWEGDVRHAGIHRQTSYPLKEGEPLELHVFVDHSVVEVFVDGREAFSTRVFPTLESSTAIDLFAEGGVATAEQVDVWQMNDAAH